MRQHVGLGTSESGITEVVSSHFMSKRHDFVSICKKILLQKVAIYVKT